MSTTDELAGLKTFFDPATLVRKGLCPVTKIEGTEPQQKHNLYFEQHGKGPEKLVFIMGLNNSCFAWATQVKHFANDPNYSVLVFDNRGVGNSDSPKGPYTTTQMAGDVETLLEYVGWTEKRGIHVVGISLGGMIALELASKIPSRLASLSLVVTTPGNWPRPFANSAPAAGLIALVKTMFIKDPVKKVPTIIGMLYPPAWLKGSRPDGQSNYDWIKENLLARIAVTRVQPPIGSLSQMYAALTHYVEPERLQKIAKSVPKILILTGDDDQLVAPSNSAKLAKYIPEAEYIIWNGVGHAITSQEGPKVNSTLDGVFKEGRKRSDAESG